MGQRVSLRGRRQLRSRISRQICASACASPRSAADQDASVDRGCHRASSRRARAPPRWRRQRGRRRRSDEKCSSAHDRIDPSIRYDAMDTDDRRAPVIGADIDFIIREARSQPRCLLYRHWIAFAIQPSISSVRPISGNRVAEGS